MRAPASVSKTNRPARAAAPTTSAVQLRARENAPASTQSQHRLANIPAHAPSQARRANGNLPAPLRNRMEQMSGIALDDVQVEYNSAHPDKLSADAYAQGNTIHVAPGQQRHLPHELWHVVQQRQGRVRPTTRVGAFHVNDNPALEREADVMGAKALVMQAPSAGAAQGEASLSRAAVMRESASPAGHTPVQAMLRRAASSLAPSAAAATRASSGVPAAAAAARSASRRPPQASLMAASAAAPRRDLHIAAAGSLRKFNDPDERKKLKKERTMISTVDSRETALQVNPQLPETEAALEEDGHPVTYGVDLLQSANLDDPATLAMHELAAKKQIDMKRMQVDFLRSPEETQEADQSLINESLAAAQASGVESFEATHAHSAARKGNNPPPSAINYEKAAKRLSNAETSTKEAEVTHSVEKVTTTDANGKASRLRTAKPNRAETTTIDFKESAPVRARLQAELARRRAAKKQ